MNIISIKNNIRDFCRKQDEIVTPILRFVWSLIVFATLQHLFNYSELGSKTEITILLAVLTALLPDAFMFLMVGALVGLHSFSVSLEVGAVFIVIFICMYTAFVRFFPNYVYALLLVPVFFVLHIPYAAPIVIALVAGIAGLVPAILGVVLYFFSLCAAEISSLLEIESAENEIEAFKQLSEVLLKNRDMYTIIVIFAITIVVISILKMFNYNYSIYIAIAAGTVTNILGSIVAGYIVNSDVPIGSVVAGSLIGIILAGIIRFCQGVLDYKHTERTQFEDDDYYYYVKAVPKLDSEKKKAKKDRQVKQTKQIKQERAGR